MRACFEGLRVPVRGEGDAVVWDGLVDCAVGVAFGLGVAHEDDELGGGVSRCEGGGGRGGGTLGLPMMAALWRGRGGGEGGWRCGQR